jgi:hypothetical protein
MIVEQIMMVAKPVSTDTARFLETSYLITTSAARKNNGTLEDFYAFNSIDKDPCVVAYFQPGPHYDYGAES